MIAIEKQAKHPVRIHQGHETTGHQAGSHPPNTQSCGRSRYVDSNSRMLNAGSLVLQKTNTDAIPSNIARTFALS